MSAAAWGYTLLVTALLWLLGSAIVSVVFDAVAGATV